MHHHADVRLQQTAQVPQRVADHDPHALAADRPHHLALVFAPAAALVQRARRHALRVVHQRGGEHVAREHVQRAVPHAVAQAVHDHVVVPRLRDDIQRPRPLVLQKVRRVLRQVDQSSGESHGVAAQPLEQPAVLARLQAIVVNGVVALEEAGERVVL